MARDEERLVKHVQGSGLAATREPGTPVGLRPPSVSGPRHNPGVASLTLFVAPHKNARLHQICALIDRRLHVEMWPPCRRLRAGLE